MTLSAPPAGDVAIGPGRLARSRATQTLESIQRGAEVVVPAPVRHANTLAAVAMDLVLATVALAVTLLLTLDLDRVVFGALVVAWPAILASNGYYLEGPFGRSLRSRSRRIVRSGAVVGLLCWAGHAATVPGLAPAQLLPATVALTLAGLTGAVLRVGDRAPRVVVAGHPSDVRDAVSELRRSRRPVDLAAVCLTEAGEPDESFADLPVHIGVNDAPEVASGVLADSLLVLPGPDLTAPQLRRLQWQAAKERTAFYLGTGLLDVAPVRLTGVETGGLGALHVRPAPVRGPRRQVKEIGERVLAALALALLLPMLLAVAVAVRRDSPGPAIFRQQRVGRNGKHFTMWKFRTMTTSAPAEVDGLSGRTTRTAACSSCGRTRASPGSAACCGATRWTSCPSSGTWSPVRCRSSDRVRRCRPRSSATTTTRDVDSPSSPASPASGRSRDVRTCRGRSRCGWTSSTSTTGR